MLRLAARRADMWDTFATTEGTATEGISSTLAERVRVFDEACSEFGRDPHSIRRSVWVGADRSGPFESPDAYVAFAEHHRDLGFTDLMAALPPPQCWSMVREIATTVIPQLRADQSAARASTNA